MLGLLVQLAISWILIWFVERQHLSVLGFRPTTLRAGQFLLFFLLAFACCTLGFLLKMYVGKQVWNINPNLTVQLLAEGLWWNIKSVLFEEFIFRGVLLYILIKRIGAVKAIIISAIAFGIYHWFSFGVMGNVVQMVIVFLLTGIMGLVLAYGYAKTFSLYVPVGIHLGWNLTQIFIFSNGPIGNGVFVQTSVPGFRTDSYLLFSLVTFIPIILFLSLSFYFIKRTAQQKQPT